MYYIPNLIYLLIIPVFCLFILFKIISDAGETQMKKIKESESTNRAKSFSRNLEKELRQAAEDIKKEIKR